MHFNSNASASFQQPNQPQQQQQQQQQFQGYPTPQATFNPLTPADLAAISQQGYAQQQAQLALQQQQQQRAAAASGGGGLQPQHQQSNPHAGPSHRSGHGSSHPHPPVPPSLPPHLIQAQYSTMAQLGQLPPGPPPGQHGMPMPGMGAMPGGMGPMQYPPQAGTPQHRAPAGSSKSGKKKGEKKLPNDAIKQYNAHIAPPVDARAYTLAMEQGRMDMAGPEPWTDAVDEVDPRELAMKRFRTRQELLSDVFGPERLKDIPTEFPDPWAGFGMDGETLEAKVAALEAENAELESKSRAGVTGTATAA